MVVTDPSSGLPVASSPNEVKHVIISLLLLLLLLLTNLCLSVYLPLSQLILVVFYHVSF